LRHLTQMCGHREQAEDFFQETFKRVHEKAHTFRGDRLRPWLLTIATRVAMSNLRKDKWMRAISLDHKRDDANPDHSRRGSVAVPDDSSNPLDEAVNAEQRQQVRTAIAHLPLRQRATLILAYYRQLSYPEVAEVMGCSVGTVKTQMYRALKTLMRRLPDVGGELE